MDFFSIIQVESTLHKNIDAYTHTHRERERERDEYMLVMKSNCIYKAVLAIQMKKPHQVIAAELQACINYTMMARLAPLWNKFGDLLVGGREFLLTKDKMRAISKLCDLFVFMLSEEWCFGL